MSTHTQKFNVGDRVKYTPSFEATTYRVIVAEPDCDGHIIIEHLDRYYSVFEKNYELAPKRYVVEVRVPKADDRFIAGGTVFIEREGMTRGLRPVIVEEL